jgi:hypothetical protein
MTLGKVLGKTAPLHRIQSSLRLKWLKPQLSCPLGLMFWGCLNLLCSSTNNMKNGKIDTCRHPSDHSFSFPHFTVRIPKAVIQNLLTGWLLEGSGKVISANFVKLSLLPSLWFVRLSVFLVGIQILLLCACLKGIFHRACLHIAFQNSSPVN